MLHLSQGLLNLFTACPRKFQHFYLDQLSLPIAPDQQDRLDWGSRFHLLMQQRELGLLDAALEISDRTEEPLYQAIEAIVQAAPALFRPVPLTEPLASAMPSPMPFRQSEHHRTLALDGYLLTVIYDLLILDEQQAQILDWKTSPRPQNARKLAENWQTRLYPFVLAETSDYLPEQISMTYWFMQAKQAVQAEQSVQAQDRQPQAQTFQPQPLRVDYTEKLHQQTSQDLAQLLCQLTQYLESYQVHAEPFPQVASSSRDCDTCAFAVRCQRGLSQGDRSEPVATLEEIQEIKL
jgi:PD-(D/E)XK nuclease superfamily